MDIDLGTEVLTIDTHCFWRGSGQFAAVNIKIPNFVPLPQSYQRKKERLQQLGLWNETTRDQYLWSDFTEDWWERFKELSQQYGISTIACSGRSGGWLVLPSYSTDSLEVMSAEVRRECVHCGNSFEDHAGKAHHCLFGSTTFKTVETETEAMLRNIVAFLRACEKDVREHASADYLFRAKDQVRQAWEDYRQQCASSSSPASTSRSVQRSRNTRSQKSL